MLKTTKKDFIYEKLSLEEQEKRQILGRLKGVIADLKNPTRNGRKYSEELWENVFNDTIMQEKIKNRCCFGELGHPTDRTEVDMEKIAICLAETPKRGEDGKLYGVFDILNTPNGRILKTLCDYGCNIGISSRGQGDLFTDIDGEEAVDPNTYECECFDVVVVPAVETARLQYVTEGLENKKSLKTALNESLSKATEEEKKVMESTLAELNINLNEDAEDMKDELYFVDYISDYGDENDTYYPELKFTVIKPGETQSSQITVRATGKKEDLEKFIKEHNEDIKTLVDEGSVDAHWLEALIDPTTIKIVVKEETNEEVDSEKENDQAKDIDDYEFSADEFITRIHDEFSPEECNKLYFTEYQFDKKPPEDDVEQRIADALREKGGIEIKEVSEVKESLEEDVDKDLETKLEAHNEYISYLTKVIEEEEKALAKEANEEIKAAIQRRLDNMRADLEAALPDAIKDAAEAPAEEVEVEKETISLEAPEEEECNGENCADIKTEEETEEAIDDNTSAIDDGDSDVIESLKEALKKVSEYEDSLKVLQEKLAVSDTKVNELTEENNQHRQAISRLAQISKASKELQDNVTALEESLKEKDTVIEDQKSRIARLVKSRKESVSESLSLNESINTKNNEVKTLKESLDQSKEQIENLTEELSKTKAESESKISELTEGLAKETSLKEAYIKLANKAVNKYIEIRANNLGLTSKDIKRKLGESYTLEDVDQVCEDLKAYQLNVSKLPFNIDRKVGIKVTEARSNTSRSNKFDDDEVDDNLIKLAKI